MDAQTKIIRASHMIDMNDIIREGNQPCVLSLKT